MLTLFSLGNSGWFGPIVCIVVIAVVFITMYWMTRPPMKEVDEEDVVESFTGGTGTTVTHSQDLETELSADAKNNNLTTQDSIVETKEQYQSCVIPEHLWAMKQELLQALPIDLYVDDPNNTVVSSDQNHAKFGLNFILSKDIECVNQGTCKLRAYVFFTYELSRQLHADIRSMTFPIDTSSKKQNVFVPIDCNVINRKRAASARIIRLLIEFEDPSSESNCAIGIEKVTVVTYGAEEGNTNEATTHKETAVEALGTQIRSGVLQVDPITLVPNNNTSLQRRYDLPRTHAILGNVIYDGYRTLYPKNSTKTYRMRLRFNKNIIGKKMYFLQLDRAQLQTNGDDINNLIPGNLKDIPRLSEFSSTNTDVNSHSNPVVNTIINSGVTGAAAGANNLSEGVGEADTDTITHNTFRQENVTTLYIDDVQPGKEYEFTFACADSRVTKSDLETLIYLPSPDEITYIELIPMNSPFNLENKPLVLTPTRENNNFYQIDSLKLDKYTEDNICTDYIVDANASIVRFNQDPFYKVQKPSLCAESKTFDKPITVNDGWMYTGTLRLPLVHPLTDENKLLQMKIKTTARAIFDFTISRIGAYLHLNGQPVTMCKMKLTANVVKFSIYIYKNMYGISINNQQPITTGTSPKLYSLYYSAGRALAKDEMDTSRHLASYPKIKEIFVKVDKETMIRSRFISAIKYVPRPTDLLILTPEECEVRLPHMAYIWQHKPDNSNAVQPQPDLTSVVTDSISWQAELESSVIINNIAETEKNVVSGEPDDILNEVYPDEKPYAKPDAKPDRECHLVKMSVGSEPLVTVFLSSTSDLYARQYEVQVRFDGCQTGPFDTRARTYALCDHTLFSRPSISAGRRIEHMRRIIIKCTLHKRRLRVCLFVKDETEAPVLIKSFTHEVSLNVDLKGKIDTFAHFKIDESKVSSFVCADRATSTLCNPYGIEEDKKKPACKINSRSGTYVDPHYKLTDFPTTASKEYVINNKYSNYKCSNTSHSIYASRDDCITEAKNKYPLGYVTHVSGITNNASGCNANCLMSDKSCKLVDKKDDQSDHTVYPFNIVDEVDYVAEKLR